MADPDLKAEAGVDETPAPQEPPRRRLPEWQFSVLGTTRLTANFLRVSLTSPDLALLTYAPGQSLRFILPGPEGALVERDYTIRALDVTAEQMEVDVFLHGDTPGPTWAKALRRGDRVMARGPRSRIRLWPDRAWYLLAGDETALPAILHMLEQVPAGSKGQAFIEIGDSRDRIDLPFHDGVTVTWVLRDEAKGAAGQGGLVARVLTWQQPEGQGQICLIGQTAAVQAMRRGLLSAGNAKEDFAAEGYWRPGRVGGTVEPLD